VDLKEVVRGEFAENAFRKDFLPSEIKAIRRAIESYERAAAKERGFGIENYRLPGFYRVSREIPMLKAFCRVAPSVRFKVRAMLPARVFFRASAFSVRTSDEDHERRFEFFAI
jgi:hypothetical protein